MSFEPGGIADKLGNSYEYTFVIFNILKVLDEELDYVKYEAFGDDEVGVDLWLSDDGKEVEGCQCKARNGSKENWTFNSVRVLKILENWKFQLSREDIKNVSLVSPLSFTNLTDLLHRAKTNNCNPSDFLRYQINSSNRKEFEIFCDAMSFDYRKIEDLERCINYLSRISYKQYSQESLELFSKEKIKLLFAGDSKIIYSSFYEWVACGKIFRKKVNLSIINEFIKDHDFILRDLVFDKKINPRIDELNKEFKKVFKPLRTGVFEREQYKKCNEYIDNGKSFVIYGKAGIGKSGCTVSIIRYCEEKNIKYIALKLDQRKPSSNLRKWGEDLGFPESIAHCIHSVSKSEKAVIILDQLDALRWTQSHSREALLVCEELINQVKILNIERKFKISIVFVCRTYDLENDNSIKSIFDEGNNSNEWEKVEIDNLEESLVKQIIGKKYETFTFKLKSLLRVPSNIYIWQHLDKSKNYDECYSASNLVLNWVEQLGENYNKQMGIVDGYTKIEATLDAVSNCCDRLGRIYIPLSCVSSFDATLKYLNSNGLIIRNDKNVSFTHQSILDCWLANSMLKSYYANPQESKPLSIIGNKDKQTPQRRYQFQIFLQNLYEYEDNDFLNFGKLLLDEKGIRFSFKFVFFEVLNQLSNPSEEVAFFIIEYCENEKWGDYIINDVILSKPQYFSIIRDAGIVEKWFNLSGKKQIIFKLLSSICNNYDAEDVKFIRSHSFKCESDDNNFIGCLPFSIKQDIDDLFELRMEFCKKYPNNIDGYFDFKNAFENNELRAIRYFACILENTIKEGGNTSTNLDDYNIEENDIFIQKGEEILDILLPYIPSGKDEIFKWSHWNAHFINNSSIERVAILLVKKANGSAIKTKEAFLKYYKNCISVDNYVYNELILDALSRLPISDSDWIVEYLYKDFDKNIFDNTSFEETSLFLGEVLLKKYSQQCTNEIFRELEQRIIHYVSPKVKDIFIRRKKYKTYFSFWGEFQYRLLSCLPQERCSVFSKKMLVSLRPKFEKSLSYYADYSTCTFGNVVSPVTGKNLTSNNWIGIITNNKINDSNNDIWNVKDGEFISNSNRSFANSFTTYVSKNPNDMISLIFNTEKLIDDVFIDSLFDGIWISDYLETIDTNRLEELIIKYYHRNNSDRARSICNILEKFKYANWSQFIIDILIDMAVNTNSAKDYQIIVISGKDEEIGSSERLRSGAFFSINCKVLSTVSSLLWSCSSYLESFKGAIEQLINDRNIAVRFSLLYPLYASYNIDKDWASKKIMYLLNQNYRFAGFNYSSNLLCTLLNSKYHDEIKNIILKCFNSDDEILIQRGSSCITRMYLLKHEFSEQMQNIEKMNKFQATGILQIATLNFNIEKYNKVVKEIMEMFMKSSHDLVDWYGKLFFENRINLERDYDFLLKIMNSKFSGSLIHRFLLYIEKNALSFFSYEKIIIEMSKNLIDNYNIDSYRISDPLVKFVIGLYDEVSGGNSKNEKRIANQCLDIWDGMFEKGIGVARQLNKEIMNR